MSHSAEIMLPDIVPLSSIRVDMFPDIERFHNAYFAKSPRPAGWLEAFSRDASRLPHGFIAIADSRIAGLIIGRTAADDARNFVLVSLLTHPDFRGIGLAGAMIKEFISSIRHIGNIRKVSLHFREGSQLEHFYAKHGFSLIGNDGAYSDGELRLLMEMAVSQIRS